MKDREQKFSPQMSGYGTYDGEVLHSVYPPDSENYAFHQSSHAYFQELVLHPDFACIAGQGVARGKRYAFNAYPDMTSADVAEGVSHDLLKFKEEFGLADKKDKIQLVSFVAAFENPKITNQLDGAENLYKLLGNMHKADEQKGYAWSTKVSKDINSPDFGFSSSGDAFFITYLYPHAASAARKSEVPMVLFTAHTIFEKMKETDAFEKMKSHIRGRQDEVHPHSANHGDANEFRQYALVDPDEKTQEKNEEVIYKALGKCPFGN